MSSAMNNALQQAAQLYSQGRFAEAEQACKKVLNKMPKNADALHICGLTYLQRNISDTAVSYLEKAFKAAKDNEQIKNNYVHALYAHANNLAAGSARYAEALPFFDLALKYRPRFPEALNNRGMALLELKDFAEAEKTFVKLLEIAPEYPYAPGWLMHARLFSCSWTGFHPLVDTIRGGVLADKPMDTPFALWSFIDDGDIQRRCALQFYQHNFAQFAKHVQPFATYNHEKIRIAYISADFRWHAVCFLMAGVFEHHDKSRFEIIGISIGVDDGSAYARRVRAAFDQVYECGDMADGELFNLLRSLDIDIAVDLTGFSANSRPAVFAARIAPVQVNYLGYPGTMGDAFMDYILADEFIVPESHQAFYGEKVVCLPDTFQANDNKRVISAHQPTRKALNLPEDALVFCSFNHAHKLTPDVFAIWIDVLNQISDSVLWLYADNELAKANLLQQAGLAGVDTSRIIFAGRADYPDHLARLACADLFLDAYPFNGGTTVSDALWAGLPVLTCAGEAFASRMGGSLLRAVGLPELVTSNLADYRQLALTLGRDRALLATYRQRLDMNRETCALFDTARFTRNLEAAYSQMYQRYCDGLPPAAFGVNGSSTNST